MCLQCLPLFSLSQSPSSPRRPSPPRASISMPNPPSSFLESSSSPPPSYSSLTFPSLETKSFLEPLYPPQDASHDTRPAASSQDSESSSQLFYTLGETSSLEVEFVGGPSYTPQATSPPVPEPLTGPLYIPQAHTVDDTEQLENVGDADSSSTTSAEEESSQHHFPLNQSSTEVTDLEEPSEYVRFPNYNQNRFPVRPTDEKKIKHRRRDRISQHIHQLRQQLKGEGHLQLHQLFHGADKQVIRTLDMIKDA